MESPSTGPKPLVTIAMPCLDEAGFIEPCLRSVQAQTYPRERIEILVADGGSTDGTRAILERLALEDPRIREIDNPDRVQAAGLNRILAEARGEIVVRMDVHCEYAPDYVEQCVTVLERTGADSVGGAQRCRGRTPFEKAVCAALESPLGVGGAAYRSAGREGFVDTVFLGAYRRAVFERVGRWDPAAITNEDAELNQRLVRSGGRIYLSREVVVYYAPRDSFTALARQYFRYGRGRARTLLKHRELLSPRPALPFLGLLAGLGMLVLAPRTGLVAASAYAGVTFAEALRVGWRDGLPSAIRAWGVFPTLHLAHATGFGVGLIRYALARDWSGS